MFMMRVIVKVGRWAPSGGVSAYLIASGAARLELFRVVPLAIELILVDAVS